MKNRIFYTGDINAEHGGMFYTLEGVKWGYVDALRIVPCSDAGGPDNLFWLERLTINLREGAALAPILECCGIGRDELARLTPAQRVHASIRAHESYGAYDPDGTEVVRIGPPCPFFDHRREWESPKIDRVLRAGSSIGRYAKRLFSKGE